MTALDSQQSSPYSSMSRRSQRPPGFSANEAGASIPQREWRERLHSLLLGDLPTAVEMLTEVADAAEWPLPSRMRVAVAAPSADWTQGATPSRVIWRVVNGRCVLIVGDDEESEYWLERSADALGLERPLVIGPAVGQERLGKATAYAIALGELVRATPSAGATKVVRCEEHEIDLLLALDPQLSRSVSERLLAPIMVLRSPRRDRMLDTLDAWLANPGRPQAMAEQLHLHVQGVRYRLAQLRELFGGALDDPHFRFELALALRVHRLHET
jgi:hypothetical protein